MSPNEMRTNWIFTFGSNQIGGLNGYVHMQDMSFNEARRLMFKMVGDKFCGQYQQGDQIFTNILNNPQMSAVRSLSRRDLPGELMDGAFEQMD